MFQWLKKRLKDPHYELLQDALLRTSPEIEAWSYQTLSRPAEKISFSRVFDGMEVSFSIEAFSENADGLHVCIDADCICAKSKVRPSHQFIKRRDETVVSL